MKKKYFPIPLQKTLHSFTYLLLLTLFVLFSGVLGVYAQEPDFAWVKRFGDSSKIAYGGTLAVDNQGNSYISTLFTGPSFNIDGIILQSNSQYSGYIAKYTPQGQIIWAKLTTGIITMTNVNTNKIIIDEEGNIYLTGEYFSGQDSSIYNYVLSTFNIDHQGERNFFLAKLDPNGNVLWVKKTYKPYYYYTNGPFNDINLDLDGNITMTGYFRESITFSSEHILSHNVEQGAVFLTKYSPDGDILLCRKLEGTVTEPFSSATSDSEQVKMDALGNLFRWSNNTTQRKLYHYDSQGELINSKILDINNVTPQGTLSPTRLQGFSIDLQGNVYLGGSFNGNLILEEQVYSGYGNILDSDAVLIKLSAENWNVEWVHIPLYSSKDSFLKLSTDGLGNIYVVGQNDDASENRMLLKKFNSQGIVLWEKIVHGLYAQGVPLGGIQPLAICQAKDGGNLWISGNFRVNAYFDETAQFMTPSLNHFNGFLVQYGTCNIAQPEINLPAVTQLCEGETMELTASFTNPDLDYKWNTGATTETITVNQAGIYYVVAQQGEECYGKSKEIWITEIPLPESSITMENGILTAIASEGTYQWINCTTQNPIAGATAQNFTPSIAGTYAVEITNEAGCSNTSNCLTVTEEDLSTDTHYLTDNSILLYPNPASDKITLQAVNEIEKITIVNMLGQVVLEHKNDVSIDITKLVKGQYILIAKTQIGIWRGKFVKK